MGRRPPQPRPQRARQPPHRRRLPRPGRRHRPPRRRRRSRFPQCCARRATTSDRQLVGPRSGPDLPRCGRPGADAPRAPDPQRPQRHVTVFAVGTWLSDHPELGRAIVAAGHDLGNHTWSHQTLPRLSSAAATAEIQQGAKAVAAIRRVVPVPVPPLGHAHLDADHQGGRPCQRLCALHLLRRRPGGLPGPGLRRRGGANARRRPRRVHRQPAPRARRNHRGPADRPRRPGRTGPPRRHVDLVA